MSTPPPRRRRVSRPAVAAAVGAVLVVAGVGVATRVGSGTGSAPSDRAPSDPADTSVAAPAPTPPVESGARARAALAALPVRPWVTENRYDRLRDFGESWADVDRNGCDTRNDILARDLTRVVRGRNCKVESGTLVSPFSGTRIAFRKGPTTSPLVQIDHIVSLSDAWRTGAQRLSARQRLALANDPLELVAVDGDSNDDKGSQDAASWLPPRVAYRCTYATLQVEVKTKYRLWVTAREAAALRAVLARCP